MLARCQWKSFQPSLFEMTFVWWWFDLTGHLERAVFIVVTKKYCFAMKQILLHSCFPSPTSTCITDLSWRGTNRWYLYRKQRLEFEEKQAPEIACCLQAKSFEVVMSLLISASPLLPLQCYEQNPITLGSHYVRCYTNAQKGIKKQEKSFLFFFFLLFSAISCCPLDAFRIAYGFVVAYIQKFGSPSFLTV